MLMEPPAAPQQSLEPPRRPPQSQPPPPAAASRGLLAEGGPMRQLRGADAPGLSAAPSELPPPGFEARGWPDWLAGQSHMSRPSAPAALGIGGHSPPGIWGGLGGLGSTTSGTWGAPLSTSPTSTSSPLSTSPTGTSSSWLPARGSERTTPTSAGATKANSSVGSVPVPYPVGPVTTERRSGAPSSMVTGGAAQASQNMLQGSTLRADAAPYTPAEVFAEGTHVF